MAFLCVHCGAAPGLGRFCASCGALQPAQIVDDPYVGQSIGERYEVGELISIGGMGRVHRGLQRSLGRPVAIKFIHPHLAASQDAAARFMIEAQAASRLNHPHVVSIYDFGRTSGPSGGDLYIVMELLNGLDLWRILEREPPLPMPRLVEIMRQTLDALGEAHRRNIVHRDIKAENIVIVPRHHGGDHVKIIDFGVASLGDRQTMRPGSLVGTPVYMAPEQILGRRVSSSFDLYAAAVLLFELLTGRLPFEASAAQTVIRQHLSAPRPDPRTLAPERNIPPALAQVCVRALDVDVARRYPTAAAFSEAILRAVQPPSAARAGQGPRAAEPRVGLAATLPATLERASPQLPFSGRAAHLLWAEAQLRACGSGKAGVLFWGRPGVGRTRLAQEIARSCAADSVLLAPRLPPPPMGEIGYQALRVIVAVLCGLDPSAPPSARRAADPQAAAKLQAVFAPDHLPADVTPAARRQAAADTLAWAVRYAVERAGNRSVILLLDDVDHADTTSRLALSDVLREVLPPRFALLLTSTRAEPLGKTVPLATRELRGLSRADAQAVIVGRTGRPLLPSVEEFEPLHLEHLGRWRATRPGMADPVSLVALIEARILEFPAEVTRVLEAVAVAGLVGVAEFGILGLPPRTPAHALFELARQGFVDVEGGQARLTHTLLGDVALDMAPDGAIAELHAHWAATLADRPDRVELRAYHAIRGAGDLAAFLLLEEAAKLRASRDDRGGAVAALRDAAGIARSQFMRGEPDALTAWALFGRKLSGVLLSAGRADEAYGVLTEILDAMPLDATRVDVLEQIAVVAEHRGQHAETERRRREAMALNQGSRPRKRRP